MVKGACGELQLSHAIDTQFPTAVVPLDAAHAIYFYPTGEMQALYISGRKCGETRDRSENPMVLCTRCARKLGYLW